MQTTQPPPRGFLIAMEGGEAAGKTTQAERLTKRLNDAGKPTLMVREPGGTTLGNHLRTYLKGRGPIGLKAETLLFIAARAQSVEQTLLPTIRSGVNVVTDRYLASTIAYQGYGRRGDLAFIDQLNAYATGGLYPDLTILLDLAPELGLQRAGKPQMQMPLEENEKETETRLDQHAERRFEDQPLAFHRRTRNGYLQLAKTQPRWATIDASNPPDRVEQEIWQAIINHLIQPGQNP